MWIVILEDLFRAVDQIQKLLWKTEVKYFSGLEKGRLGNTIKYQISKVG